MNTYIIFDLEWNQGYEGNSNPDIPFEIIEIGAVKLDSDKNIIDRFSCLIKPQVYKKINHITKQVIHIKMSDLSDSDVFPKVMKAFLKWCGKDYVFCTWGSLDLTELQTNMRYYGMKPLASGPISYLDIQKLFSLAKEDGRSRRSLEYAVDFLGLEKKDDFHRATNDALYTALIFKKIHSEELEGHYSFDVFHTPIDRNHEIHVQFDTYSKYISREFPEKQDALSDREASSLRCHICKKDVKRKIPWFSMNGKNYYALGQCPEHGYQRGKLRIKKADGGRVYVVKTIRDATEEDRTDLFERYKQYSETTHF